jgi:hypothetical protein
MRLDVIDTNPRAQRLCERSRFRPMGIRSLGPLRILLGFRHTTTMVAESKPPT